MVEQRKKLLIIDGYNVLRSGSRYAATPVPDYTDDAFNRAREALIDDVVSFAGSEYSAIVVFDGAKNKNSMGNTETINGIKVVFSAAGQSADKVIEKLAHNARERTIETLVVTSDGTIQDTVFGGGVDRMSANDFSWEISTLLEDAKKDAPQTSHKRNTLADRLDPSIVAKLEQLRDGTTGSHK